MAFILYCNMCESKTHNGALFCSKECEERHYDYISLSIPKEWIKRTLRRLNCGDRILEIKSFSKRHNLNIELVLLKIERNYTLKKCKDKN